MLRKSGFRLAEGFSRNFNIAVAMAASAIGLVYRNHRRKLRTSTTAPANRKVLSCVEQWSGY